MPAADAALVHLLKRDRVVVATALGLLTLLAWAYVVFLSSHMAMPTEIPPVETPTAAPSGGMAGMDMGAGGAATDDMAVVPMNDIGGGRLRLASGLGLRLTSASCSPCGR
jgi:predicted metal-binding membrane protein